MNALTKITWTLSALRAFLYSLIVTGSSFKAAVAVTAWSAMDHDKQVELIVGLFVVQAGVMLAFLDQSIAKLQGAETPGQTKPS